MHVIPQTHGPINDILRVILSSLQSLKAKEDGRGRKRTMSFLNIVHNIHLSLLPVNILQCSIGHSLRVRPAVATSHSESAESNENLHVLLCWARSRNICGESSKSVKFKRLLFSDRLNLSAGIPANSTCSVRTNCSSFER